MPDKEWSPLETGVIFTEDGGESTVDFKTSNTGETLIANHDVNQGNSSTFDTQRDDSGSRIEDTGLHNHYGDNSPSWAANNNTTNPERPYYTGPDH